MRTVAASTRRHVRQIFRSRGKETLSNVVQSLKRRNYEWPYARVLDRHVEALLVDLGLHKVETDVYPFTCWALDPPTPQEKAAKFLAWAEENKRSGGYGCCDSHHAHAEGFNEATDDLVERLKSDFPEIFTAASEG